MKKAVSDEPIGTATEWRPWFAWRPVWTRERAWAWLVWLERREAVTPIRPKDVSRTLEIAYSSTWKVWYPEYRRRA